MSNKINGSKHDRAAELVRLAGPGDGPTTYAASLSSEAPVDRWFGVEILTHEKKAINLSRAQGRGLPLLWNHNTDAPIGVVKNVRLDKDRRLVGDLVFSNNDQAQRIKAEVDQDFLGDVSIRYTIDNYTEEKNADGVPVITVDRWSVLEASIVSVPADHTVGVGRNETDETQPVKEGTTMTTKTGGTGEGGGGINVVEFNQAREAAKNEGIASGASIERERIASIDELFAGLRHKGDEFSALRGELIKRGSSIDQARAAVLDLINTGVSADEVRAVAQPGADAARVTAGETADEKFGKAVERAIEIKTGLINAKSEEGKREIASNEFTGYRMTEIAREYLGRRGVRTAGMSSDMLIRAALANSMQRDVIGFNSSDFTNILANVAHKSLGRGYMEAPEVWQKIVRVGSVPDFKAAKATTLSAFSALDQIAAGGEYKHGKFTDKGETIQAYKFGKLFSITREALINDDLSALSAIPRAMGMAANRTVGDKVFALLTSPPTMGEDSLGLFHANHNNTGTAGAPSVTTWDEMRKLMAKQKDPQSTAVLNIRPSIMIVPVALETTGLILRNAAEDPIGNSGAKGGARQPNPFYNTFEVVADARLDTNSATKWYGSADPSIYDAIGVDFVGGRTEPYLESKDGWNVDGVEYKVRHEFAATVYEWRTLTYNAG